MFLKTKLVIKYFASKKPISVIAATGIKTNILYQKEI